MTFLKSIFYITTALIFISSCQSESDKKQENTSTYFPESDTIKLSNSWARPGSEGANSATYLQIFNGTKNVDTLRTIRTDIAEKAEVHESFEKNGMTGMRPAGVLAIQPDSGLVMRPGGFHIMLINLRQNLAVNDSIILTLRFTRAGDKEITVPVQISK